MKITQVKFHNSVKVGKEEILYTNDQRHDIRMDENMLIWIREKGVKGGEITFSSIFNTVYAKAILDGQDDSDKTAKGINSKAK